MPDQQKLQEAVVRAEGTRQAAFEIARRIWESDINTMPQRQAEYEMALKAAEIAYSKSIIAAADKFDEPHTAAHHRERLAGLPK